MSIYDKAKALADEIAASDELRRVKETELKMLIDLTAREIVESYQAIQMEAINAGIPYDQLDEAKKAQLTELENQMQANEVIMEYMNANQELNQMLESVNMIISSALNPVAAAVVPVAAQATAVKTIAAAPVAVTNFIIDKRRDYSRRFFVAKIAGESADTEQRFFF